MTTSTYSFDRIGGPTQLNTVIASDQFDPAVVTFAGGNGVVLFDGGNRISARAIDASGEPVGAQFDVSTGTGAAEPETTLLSNGNVLVTWQDGTGNTKALGRIYAPDLTPLTGLLSLEAGSVPFKQPDVAATADGGFVVVSHDVLSATDTDIFIHMFDASGTVIHSAAFAPGSTLDENPSVAVLANGNVAVAWERHVGANTEVWRAVYSPDLLTTIAAPAAFDASGSINQDVDVTARPDGSFVVSYEDNSVGNLNVVSRIFSSTGVAGASSFTGSATGSDAQPNSASSSDGYVVLAVEDQTNPSGWNVNGALITPDGATVSVNTILEGADGHQFRPAVTWVDGSTVQLAYSTSGTGGDGDGYGVAVSRFHVIHTSMGDATDENIQGDGLIDIINGLGGVDTLNGAGDNDKLFGGTGHDILKGGTGDDELTGGRGNDRLIGGGGADTFIFAQGETGRQQAGADTIFDFTLGDKIDLSAIDAKATPAGDQQFTFIESDKFHHQEGELRFDKEKSDTWIYGDTDGNGKANFIIHLDDAVTLTGGSFEL
jgi:Ca2+-binding RTX toxin-like protein